MRISDWSSDVCSSDLSLAYVALTRARHQTHIHAVADMPAQAIDDLHHHWARRDTQTWAIDTRPTPGAFQPLAVPEKLQRARAQAALEAPTSPRPTPPPAAPPPAHTHRQPRQPGPEPPHPPN